MMSKKDPSLKEPTTSNHCKQTTDLNKNTTLIDVLSMKQLDKKTMKPAQTL